MLFFTFDSEQELKIEHLYHTYKYLLYKVAFDILGDKSLSEDALQETFVRVMKNLHKIGEENCPRTRNFLVVICRNVALDMKRKTPLVSEYDQNTAVENAVEATIEAKDSIDRLTGIINGLDPIYRDVFLLRRVHNLSRREIAKILGISLESVKKRLTRAKEYIYEKARREGLL